VFEHVEGSCEKTPFECSGQHTALGRYYTIIISWGKQWAAVDVFHPNL